MSFISDIIKYGLGQFGIQASGDTPSAIASSAITNFLNEKVKTVVKKQNPEVITNTVVTTPTNTSGTGSGDTKEIEVKLELKASTDTHIPVVYGEAWLKGALTDAYLSADGCVMWYCITLCEVTGNKLDGTASSITIEDIYWDDQKVTVLYDGVTVGALWDGRPGSYTQNTDISGQVRIYLYNNGSESPTNIRTQGLSVTHGNAYDVFPTWTSSHQMSNLVFALIRVDYNSTKDVTGPKNVIFKVKNSMTDPGDVMYDYLTNSIYGAGLDATEVDV